MNHEQRHFQIFRILLGLFSCFYFVRFGYYAEFAIGKEGVIPSSRFPSLGIINLFSFFGNSLGYDVACYLAAFVSLLFAFKLLFILASLFLWFSWSSITYQVPMYSCAYEGYLGYLFIASLLAEPTKLGPIISKELRYSGGLVLGFAYLASALNKWNKSPGWVNGQVVEMLCNTRLMNSDLIASTCLSAPPWFLKTLTWGGLGMEFSFLFLFIIKRTRWLAFLLGSSMHLGTLIFMQIIDVSLAMLLMYVFIWDPSWTTRVLAKLNLMKGS